MDLANEILEGLGINPERLSLEWVSAAEGVRFVRLIGEFTERIRGLGPLGASEGLDTANLYLRLEAAKMALEGKKLRMAIGRLARQKKDGETYREVPEDHKYALGLKNALKDESVSCEMLLYLREGPRAAEELAELLDISSDEVVDTFKKLEKKRLVEPERLILG